MSESMPPETTTTSSQPLGVVQGTRLCAKCSYNLIGQSIQREEHYDLLIARCPECGTVASVVEYPALAKWSGRMALLLAVVYVLFLLGMIFGSSMACFGMEMAFVESASEPVRDAIQTHYSQAEKDGIVPPGNAWSNFGTWWDTQADQRVVLNDVNVIDAITNRVTIAFAFLLGLLLVVLGAIWSVILLRAPMMRKLTVVGLITGLAAIISAFPVMDWYAPGRMVWMHIVCYRVVAIPAMATALVWSSVCVFIGLIIGPKLARWFVALLLPPSRASILSALWTADGLEPPRSVKK